MTTNIREIIDQAFEAGRSVGKLEMAERARLGSIYPATAINSPEATLPDRMHARHATAKATAAPKAPKTTPVARGVKAAPKARTKGVKSAITGLITSGPMTVDSIIERTGFKKNSIVSTLMDLKKKGLAMQDGKAWVSMADAGNGGNSETGAYAGS